MDNISTNFPGFSNLPSSVALHHLSLQSESFTAVVATPAADINFIGSLEGGTIITDVSFSSATPALAAGVNWNLVAKNADGDVIVAVINDGATTINAYGVGMWTKLIAPASNNIRLFLTPVTAPTNYGAGGLIDVTLRISYINAH